MSWVEGVFAECRQRALLRIWILGIPLPYKKGANIYIFLGIAETRVRTSRGHKRRSGNPIFAIVVPIGFVVFVVIYCRLQPPN